MVFFLFLFVLFHNKIFNRTVINAHVDILVVVAETFSENRQSADMLGLILDFQFQFYGTVIVEVKFIYGNIRYLQSVDESRKARRR